MSFCHVSVRSKNFRRPLNRKTYPRLTEHLIVSSCFSISFSLLPRPSPKNNDGVDTWPVLTMLTTVTHISSAQGRTTQRWDSSWLRWLPHHGQLMPRHFHTRHLFSHSSGWRIRPLTAWCSRHKGCERAVLIRKEEVSYLLAPWSVRGMHCDVPVDSSLLKTYLITWAS